MERLLLSNSKPMIIYLQKFGTTLVSRQSGKEAFAAFQSTLNQMDSHEPLVVDFDGVITFSPSWGDEFLVPLFERFKQRCIFKNTKNLSVIATLKILEQVHEYKFSHYEKPNARSA